MREHSLTNYVTVIWCLHCGHLRTWPAIEVEGIGAMRERLRCTHCRSREVGLRIIYGPVFASCRFHSWEARLIADAVHLEAERAAAAAQVAHSAGDKVAWNKHDSSAMVLRRLERSLREDGRQADEELAGALQIPPRDKG